MTIAQVPTQDAKAQMRVLCKGEMAQLLTCKRDRPQDFKTACHHHAIDVANCAAQQFCSDALAVMRAACLKSPKDPLACKNAKIQLDNCFIDKGFPIRPPSSY